MPEKYDRRQILKWIGASLMSLVLIPLGLAGCGGGEEDTTQSSAPTGGGSESSDEKSSGQASSGSGSSNGGTDRTHEVPHPDDVKLSDAEVNGEALGGAQRGPGGKSPKDGPSVQYQHEPNGDKNCGNCTMFVPDQNDDGYGACTLVEGEIHPCDFCILYSEHTGEGSVACGAT